MATEAGSVIYRLLSAMMLLFALASNCPGSALRISKAVAYNERKVFGLIEQ